LPWKEERSISVSIVPIIDEKKHEFVLPVAIFLGRRECISPVSPLLPFKNPLEPRGSLFYYLAYLLNRKTAK
jgi:hypothetical protein